MTLCVCAFVSVRECVWVLSCVFVCPKLYLIYEMLYVLLCLLLPNVFHYVDNKELLYCIAKE